MEFISLTDLTPIIPEIIVLLTACTVLLVDLFAAKKKQILDPGHNHDHRFTFGNVLRNTATWEGHHRILRNGCRG